MPGPVLSVFIATFIVTLSAVGASAAPPTVEYLFPAGAPQGTTVEVTAGGKLDEWPLKLWADHPGITAEFSKDKGKLSVKVEAAVPAGPHLVRLYGAQGPAAPRVFVVGTGKEAREAEPNDEVSKAQPVDALPVTINGRLEKSGDVDSYAVKVEAGQWLSATVTGRRLGSPMDPLIHLYEATGNQLAFVHDGLGLDPLLVYRAQKAGTYVVRVAAFKYPPAADVKLAGEAEDVYRLTLSNAPPPRFAMPAGVTRGAKGSVHLFGWDSAETGTREVDATHLADGADTLAVDDLPVAVGDGPERAEAEVTEPLAAPAAVTGFLRTAGEQDAYRFAAKKGERVTVEASAAALASPMDAVLRLQDDSGKELAANDDERGQAGDARLEWTAPADGVYRVVVSDLYGNGGTEYVYRLAMSVPAPRIVATADADEYRVAPGKSVSVKLNVSRQGGYAAGLVAVATGLPAGVTATSADVPDKGGDLTLTFTAAADARPAAGPIRVMLLGTDPAHPVAWVAYATLRKEASQELIPRTDALWLTVLPP